MPPEIIRTTPEPSSSRHTTTVGGSKKDMTTIRSKNYDLTGLRRSRVSISNKEILSSIDEIEARPEDLAFYITACIHAADNLTGGLVPGCKGWSDTQWIRSGIAFPLSRHSTSRFWSWEGDDLILSFYDHDGDEAYVKGVMKGKALTKLRDEKRSGPPPQEKRAATAGGPPVKAGRQSPHNVVTMPDHASGSTANGHEPEEINRSLGINQPNQ